MSKFFALIFSVVLLSTSVLLSPKITLGAVPAYTHNPCCLSNDSEMEDYVFFKFELGEVVVANENLTLFVPFVITCTGSRWTETRTYHEMWESLSTGRWYCKRTVHVTAWVCSQCGTLGYTDRVQGPGCGPR